MDKYIEGNKAAWEEAFENRTDSWGADITERIRKEDYSFFNEETENVLKQIRTEGAVIGQFCCNNGRELLSLVKSGKARKGIGFYITLFLTDTVSIVQFSFFSPMESSRLRRIPQIAAPAMQGIPPANPGNGMFPPK